MTDPRYPIGEFVRIESAAPAQRERFIDEIASLPARLREAVAGLSDAQLDTPYRPGGWSLRQVVHHLPDSHMNAYIRLKLALTEDDPPVKTYAEDRWAELPDVRHAPIGSALDLLELLHARWTAALRALRPGECARAYVHPEMGRVPLDTQLALYAWHGQHHTAHITALRAREGW